MQKTNKPVVEIGDAVEIVSILSYSVSTDGRHALIALQTADDRKLALTFRTDHLRALQATVNDVVSLADRNGADAGNVPIKYPRTVEVGTSEQIRGQVLVHVDDKLPSEQMLAFPWSVALTLAARLQERAFAITTPQQRAGLRGLAVPRAPSIILPEGHG